MGINSINQVSLVQQHDLYIQVLLYISQLKKKKEKEEKKEVIHNSLSLSLSLSLIIFKNIV